MVNARRCSKKGVCGMPQECAHTDLVKKASILFATSFQGRQLRSGNALAN